MTTLEFAAKAANKLQICEEFPMAAILKWFDSFKDGDKFGVFYSDSNIRENAEFYCNAPDYQTAIKDIIAEMPFAAKLSNPNPNEFVVYSGNSGYADYYRKWYVIEL